MYILSILSVIAMFLLTIGMSSAGIGVISYYIDMPSLIILLILCFPMLISSGLLKDFNRAFHIVMSKNRETSLNEIKRSIEAVDLVIKILTIGGAFIAVASFILVLALVETPEQLGPNLAVTILSLVYALAFALILLPLKSRLKVKMIEYMG